LPKHYSKLSLHQRRRKLGQGVQQTAAVDFFNALTGPELLEITEASLPEHRERLYPPTVTLSMFIKQSLDEDGSCQRAVNGWAAQRIAEGLGAQSIGTGAYCKARQRLPLEMITTLTRHSGGWLHAQAPTSWRWRGRAVKLVDGTGISMPDTAVNQARYPQPNSQMPGVGFPSARLVGITCLSTGAILDAAIGPSEGKGSTEQHLLRRLHGSLSDGDVLLGDAQFGHYFEMAMLQAKGVDALFEQHGARTTDFRRGKRLGPRDHLVSWCKPRFRPRWMTPEQYLAAPDEVVVRELEVGGRVLICTLLDARKVPKKALGDLYARRWQVELDLRNIKTTLGMDVLRCRTPAMIEKELWVHLLAYNLIRLLMAQAALEAGIHPRELSFKHTLQLWTQWTSVHRTSCTDEHRADLFRLIAQLKVGKRPGRIDPRECKRRPKSTRWLKVPREQARQQIRLHSHQLNA
jgi:IS4 transposase